MNPCLPAADLLTLRQFLIFMTLDETFEGIKACASDMNSRYGDTVFDEWAIVSLVENKARVLAYIGPRNDEFLQNFVTDLGALRAELHAEKYSVGDFEFNRHGVGTGHEVFMVLGRGLYLICNNTRESMESIAKNPRWLNAQVPFAELSDRIRANPLSVSGDNTKFLKKD
jgi:hypothetical protein